MVLVLALQETVTEWSSIFHPSFKDCALLAYLTRAQQHEAGLSCISITQEVIEKTEMVFVFFT